MSSQLLAGCTLAAIVGVAGSTRAADIDYVELFRQNAIRCIHRTVNPDKARIEITKGPDVTGDMTVVRFKTYYDGLIKKNVMETELLIRQSGTIRQMKLNQLADTGTGIGSCDLEKNWQDF